MGQTISWGGNILHLKPPYNTAPYRDGRLTSHQPNLIYLHTHNIILIIILIIIIALMRDSEKGKDFTFSQRPTV